MNISGKSVSLAYRSYIRPSSPSHILVFHDSLSHKPLSLHPRLGGSANGHNGVTSVINAIASPAFHRVRVGIGRPEAQGRYDGYVLEKMDKEELVWWGAGGGRGAGEGVDKAWQAVEDIVGDVLNTEKTA